MKNKENLMKLLKDRKPIRLFLLDSDFGIFDYDPKYQVYRGLFGCVPIEALYKSIQGYEEYNHLRIEEI